jgi:diketogulonate reductase-like aldo/keto reductase
MKTFELKNGKTIPCIGLGTWQLNGEICSKAVVDAIDIGYRHVDTAEIYGNQQNVGEGIKKSGIRRKEIFLTSKVWRSNLKKQDVVDSCKETIEALNTDYIDLYLVHWPNEEVDIKETLEAMELLKEEGLIKNYGVSNFTKDDLEKTKGFEVVIDQIEFHPTLYQKELKEYCDKRKIVITAYSPLAQGLDLKLPQVVKISEKYKKSTAQIVLNWLRQHKIVAIPRSAEKDHIKDNFESLNWDLEKEDVETLDSLNKDMRVINPGFASWNKSK